MPWVENFLKNNKRGGKVYQRPESIDLIVCIILDYLKKTMYNLFTKTTNDHLEILASASALQKFYSCLTIFFLFENQNIYVQYSSILFLVLRYICRSTVFKFRISFFLCCLFLISNTLSWTLNATDQMDIKRTLYHTTSCE